MMLPPVPTMFEPNSVIPTARTRRLLEDRHPAARCAMGNNVFLYNHQASSGVESMNRANQPARDRAAVDVVNATILLLEMERYVCMQHCYSLLLSVSNDCLLFAKQPLSPITDPKAGMGAPSNTTPLR